MKISIISLTFISLLAPFICNAQDNPREKIESAKIAFITEKLNLSPSEAQKFWPLYNEFSNKQNALQKEMKKARLDYDFGDISDKEARALIEKSLDIKARELELDRSYAIKFQEAISPVKVLKLHRAEADFKRLLLRRLEQRAGNRRRN